MKLLFLENYVWLEAESDEKTNIGNYFEEFCD